MVPATHSVVPRWGSWGNECTLVPGLSGKLEGLTIWLSMNWETLYPPVCVPWSPARKQVSPESIGGMRQRLSKPNYLIWGCRNLGPILTFLDPRWSLKEWDAQVTVGTYWRVPLLSVRIARQGRGLRNGPQGACRTMFFALWDVNLKWNHWLAGLLFHNYIAFLLFFPKLKFVNHPKCYKNLQFPLNN